MLELGLGWWNACVGCWGDRGVNVGRAGWVLGVGWGYCNG